MNHRFDLRALLDVVGGDRSLLAEVAALGASDLDRLLHAMESASSVFELGDLAHELKGVLLNLTAEPAAARALAVESAARNGDEARARKELARADATFREVLSTLSATTTGATS